MTKEQVQQESLTRARFGQSASNYPAIYKGFLEMGILESEILPRENVFTYPAWKALGRQVRRGEHGVKVSTVQHSVKKDAKTGEEKRYSFPTRSTVFHVSQTDATTANAAASWKPTQKPAPAPAPIPAPEPFRGPVPEPAAAPGPLNLHFEYLGGN